MFSALLAILGSVFSAIWGILAKLPWQLYVAIGLVLLGGWIFHGGSCREFACKRPDKPPKSDTFDVAEVPTGASVVVRYGLKGRKRATIALAHIAAPASGPAAATACCLTVAMSIPACPSLTCRTRCPTSKV